MNAEKSFAERLTKITHEAELTQETVAEICEASQSAVSRWMKGESTPHAKTIERLGMHLKINPHWLLTGEGPRDLPTGAQRTAMKIAYGKPGAEPESKELRLARERVEILKLQIQEAELRKKLAELEGTTAPGVTPAGFQARKEGESTGVKKSSKTK